MGFSQSFLDDLRARLPVSAVVGRKVSLKKEGHELVGLSPFNKETTPSFKVNDSKGLWHDFSAGRGGDQFAFLVEVEGRSFPEAVEICAQIAGVPLPNGTANGAGHRDRARPRPVSDDDSGEVDARGGDDPGDPADGGGRTEREIAATYDYTTPQGDLIYQVVRLEWTEDGKRKKTFRQRRPHPDKPGEWVWNLQGVEHGLYRLVEFREADPDAPVFLPEGEKDADTLWDLGLPATTNSGGAKNWRGDHAEFFRDRDVVIPIDNDIAGRERGEIVAKSLRGVARRVRILDFAKIWPCAPKGADVTDWRKAREGTPEELAKIVEGVPDWCPEPFVSKFGGRSWEDIGRGTVDIYPWVVENIIPAGEAVLMFGESGSGKSFDAFDMAMCIARGQSFNGHNVEPGLVIYAAAEAGKGFEKRKRAYCQHHAIDPRAPLPFYLMTKRFDLFHGDDDANALTEEMKAVCGMYPNDRIRLIVLDTLSATTPGMNENASQDVGPVKSRIDRIRVELGAAVALVHHKPKGGSTPRGHGSLTADYETTIEFLTTDLLDADNRKIHVATVQKQREGKSGLSWRFTLPIVEVGKNKWGNPDTSCVVVAVGSRKQQKGFKATDQEMVFMQALLEAAGGHGVTPRAAGLDLPASIAKVVDAKQVRSIFRRKVIRQDEDDGTHDGRIRQAWSRATRVLRKARVIGYDDPFIWWAGRPVAGIDVTQAVPEAPAPTNEDEVFL
jgi:hypothetical protein